MGEWEGWAKNVWHSCEGGGVKKVFCFVERGQRSFGSPPSDK